MDVAPPPAGGRGGDHAETDREVPAFSRAGPLPSFARDANRGTVLRPRGDLDLDPFDLFRHARSPALRAPPASRPSGSPACRARPGPPGLEIPNGAPRHVAEIERA